jgi:CheY-like chemotaxis protein
MSHVVIVEDDVELATSIADLLHGAGYTTAVAHDGAAALLILSAAVLPGLVILDLLLPDLDGFGVLHALRGDPRLARIPVCVVSALTDGVPEPPDVASTLRKPIDPAQLLFVVRHYCGAP